MICAGLLRAMENLNKNQINIASNPIIFELTRVPFQIMINFQVAYLHY